MSTPDRDLCARCGNRFPPGQVCESCRPPDKAAAGQLAVFGGVDGLVMFLGLTLGLIVSRQSPSAVWHAALGGAAGELVGMTAGQHLSDPDSGWLAALACGGAGALACISPAWPFLIWSRVPALETSLAFAWVIAGVIAVLRPEHGWAAVMRTYGILIAAGILSGLTGLALDWPWQRYGDPGARAGEDETRMSDPPDDVLPDVPPAAAPQAGSAGRMILLASLALLAVSGWAIAAYEHGFAHFTGIDTQQSQNYDFVSGVGPMIITAVGLSTLIAGAWHVLNCHADGCARIGTHRVAGGRFKVCLRHHREVTGHPRKLTTELLRVEHLLHLGHARNHPDQPS